MTDAQPAKMPKPARKLLEKPADGGPILLSGGNPQIPKGYGEAPVAAYLDAMPGWKQDVGRKLDALIVKTVPEVQKAVKWNTPFYGLDGKTFGIAWHNDTASSAAMTAVGMTQDNQQRLAAQSMYMRPDVLDNEGVLLVAVFCKHGYPSVGLRMAPAPFYAVKNREALEYVVNAALFDNAFR